MIKTKLLFLFPPPVSLPSARVAIWAMKNANLAFFKTLWQIISKWAAEPLGLFSIKESLMLLFKPNYRYNLFWNYKSVWRNFCRFFFFIFKDSYGQIQPFKSFERCNPAFFVPSIAFTLNRVWHACSIYTVFSMNGRESKCHKFSQIFFPSFLSHWLLFKS